MRKILLVDEDPHVLAIGRLTLGRSGNLEILVAASGAEALELATRERPDAILLSSGLPGSPDASEAFEILRRGETTKHTPVIFTLDGTRWTDRAELLRTGGAGVLAKPFLPASFQGDVQRLVREWREGSAEAPTIRWLDGEDEPDSSSAGSERETTELPRQTAAALPRP